MNPHEPLVEDNPDPRDTAFLEDQINGHNIAVMNLQTEEYDGQPADNFLVARYSKDLNRRSRVGGLLINKESLNSDRFNRVLVADALYAPTRAFSVHTIAAQSARASTHCAGRSGPTSTCTMQ